MRETIIAKEAAMRAGRVALDFQDRRPKVYSKGDGVDFKSEADIASETVAREYLEGHSRVPVAGEDTGGDEGAETTWLLDCIDGSPGFLHGLKGWGTVVHLRRDGEGVITVVYLPGEQEMYVAERGGTGEYRRLDAGHWAPLHVTEETNPKRVIVASDLGYENRDEKLGLMGKFSGQVQYCPVYGSSSWSSAKLASGHLGGYVIFGVPDHDIDPERLLMERAGATVHVTEEGAFGYKGKSMIAGANTNIYTFLCKELGVN